LLSNSFDLKEPFGISSKAAKSEEIFIKTKLPLSKDKKKSFTILPPGNRVLQNKHLCVFLKPVIE